jgi:hypothetical protein
MGASEDLERKARFLGRHKAAQKCALVILKRVCRFSHFTFRLFLIIVVYSSQQE